MLLNNSTERQIKLHFLFSVLGKQCSSTAVYSSSGPVYVSPNAPVQVVHVEPTRVERDPSTYETQTVYGFLDFTTTIGNTIMVFSPNSAPPPGIQYEIII